MATTEPYHDERKLRHLYWGKGLTTYEIAEKYGVSRSTIQRWMERLGIERRRAGAKRGTVGQSESQEYNYTSITLTDGEIAEEFRELRDERNLTTTGLIKRLMDQYEG